MSNTYNSIYLRSAVTAAIFTALIAVLSPLSIMLPFGIPVTLQTFAVALCGYTLGFRWGTAATAAYILLGTVGVPVFSGFTGGVGILFGKTGGFIFGFLLLVIMTGIAAECKTPFLRLLAGVIGLAGCHLAGIIQFMILNGMSFIPTFLLVSLPFLIKDALSVIVACFLAVQIRHLLKKMRKQQ